MFFHLKYLSSVFILLLDSSKNRCIVPYSVQATSDMELPKASMLQCFDKASCCSRDTEQLPLLIVQEKIATQSAKCSVLGSSLQSVVSLLCRGSNYSLAWHAVTLTLGVWSKSLCYARSQGLPTLAASTLVGAKASVVRGACFGRRMGT